MKENQKNSRLGVLIPLLVICMITYMFLKMGGGNPNLADVRGVITLDGKPLPNAFVLYMPVEKGATSFGKTDANGNYRMRFSDTESGGAFIGVNRVSIGTGDIAADNSGSIPELVPSIYNTQTTLVADVQPGRNTFDFDLQSNDAKIDRVAGDFRDDGG